MTKALATEAAFRDLAAVLPEPHWLLTADGKMVAANPAATALVGRPAATLTGAPFAALVSDDATRVARYLAMCARSLQMVPGALTLRTDNGTHAPCRCDGAAIRRHSPDAPALLVLRCRPKEATTKRFVALTARIDALNREITRREEVERILRQQAELLDQTYDAILVWALGGGITYVNRAAEDLYGWRRAEAIGRPIHDIVRAPAAALTMAAVERVLRDTGRWTGELVHTTRDGREVVVESRMVLLPAEGGHPLVLETVRDVTDARRARTQLELTQRLEAVGRLAGGVAHEINNALQGALGFSAFALSRLAPHDPARDDVQQAFKAAERAAAITQGLLAFSGRQLLQPSNFSLGAIVGEFAPMLRQAAGRDRELQLELPPTQAVVHADRGQLEQVLLNLVLNARDATGAGGRITVRVSSAALTDVDLESLARPDLPPGRYARLEVADSGHGMDEATVSRIFEPFYTTKAPGQGTGLGLAVVHGIVHQSGGAIAVRSAPGQGTTFTIHLPLAEAGVAGTAGTQDRIRGGAERILVVDDEPVIVQLASRVLKEGGYTVLTATNGADALRCVEELAGAQHGTDRPPVDLVLSDVIMPVLSGRELGEALARRYPGLPVLYTSGHPGEETACRELLVNGAEFIQKPFHPDRLLLRVRALLDQLPKA